MNFEELFLEKAEKSDSLAQLCKQLLLEFEGKAHMGLAEFRRDINHAQLCGEVIYLTNKGALFKDQYPEKIKYALWDTHYKDKYWTFDINNKNHESK